MGQVAAFRFHLDHQQKLAPLARQTRGGTVIARSPPATTALNLPGRPASVDFTMDR